MVVRAMYSNVQCFYFLLYFYHNNIHHIFVFKIHIYFFLHVFIVNLWFFFFIFQTTIVSGRRGSTSSDKKRSKSRARSKSPFRSFRWPKSKSAARQEPQPGSYSDDEDNVSGSARSTLRKFFRENIIWYIMFCCAISRNFWRGEIILNFFIPWNCIKVVEYFVQILVVV